MGLGLVLAVVGLGAYVAQVMASHLWAPWYLPLSGTLGVLLLVAALVQARSVWRWLALLLVLLLTGVEWSLLLGLRLPPYTGPVAVGHSFPAFTTTRADGSPFTQRDLQADQHTVFVFFRGRW
jgi:hypothetical protein